MRIGPSLAVGAVLAVLWGMGAMAEGGDPSLSAGHHGATSEVIEGKQAPKRDGGAEAGRRDRRAAQEQGRRDRPRTSPAPAAQQSSPRPTYLVTRIVDGDTLELGNGETVRLVGIDTPEVGVCGFEEAGARLAELVLGRRVTLAESDEERDGYGRLLRYVDAAGRDAGLALVQEGLAIARYDSRDGYGFHPREPRYVDADRHSARGPRCQPAPVPLAGNPGQGAGDGGQGCAPGYQPCVPPAPPDLDCGDLAGPIRVSGADPHRLDGDGDGIACE